MSVEFANIRPDDLSYETPAAKVFRLIGIKRVASACDLCTDACRKWESRGGGDIPARYQRTVLRLAKHLGVALTAADVVGMP